MNFIITLSAIFLIKVGYSQLPENYSHLEYLFTKKTRQFEGDLPDSLSKSIDTSLLTANIIYQEYFYPGNYESRDTIGFSLVLKENRLQYVVKKDTIVYRVENWYYDNEPEMFGGNLDVFLNNESREHIGYLSIYYLNKEVSVIKEFIYIDKKFLFFHWNRIELRSVFLLEL